jgi:ubiquinone/menaquinone biosynthesis C-methylase UbiE
MSEDKPKSTYILGHSDAELQRLINQSRLFGDLTEQVFRLAGLQPGARVLDVGCGSGDVSFLAASMVGPTGSVVGIDKSPDAIAVAQQRVKTLGSSNISFEVADVAEYKPSQQFDAVVGRLILMYFPGPALTAMLKRFASYVKPGGLLAFQEMEMSLGRSMPEVPMITISGDRIRETFRRAGLDYDIGPKLYPAFISAGLPAPKMILGGRIEAGEDGKPAYEWLAQTTRSLLPLMLRFGVATAAEIDIDTLSTRIKDAVVAANAVFLLPALVGAWARV